LVNFLFAIPSPSSGNNVWNIGDLKSGDSGNIIIVVRVSPAAENGKIINNTANINSKETVSLDSNRVTHTVTKPSCTCEDILEALSDIEGKLWSWENSVKSDTMAIWTLKNNVHNWANLTVALDDIKSEIEEILYRLGKAPEGSTGTIWGDINRIWSLTNNVHNWANLTEALDDIKSEIEEINGGATVSITKLDVRIPEQGDVGQSEWGKIWDLDAGPDSTNDLFFFLIVTRADNGQPVTGLTTSDFSVTFHDRDDASITKSLTVSSVTESGGVYRIVLSSNGLVDDDGVLKIKVTTTISSETFTGTILIAVKK